MSHTFVCEIEGETWYVHHNSDCSGMAELVAPSSIIVKVPARLLLEFVAHVVKRDRITKLEEQGPKAVLGLSRSYRIDMSDMTLEERVKSAMKMPEAEESEDGQA